MDESDDPGDVRDRARAAYDTVAENYAAALRDQLDDAPVERHVLALFAELTRGGAVVDAGCGPGHVTAHLAALGVEVSGFDLSSEMVRVATALHPGIPFAVAAMEDLDRSGLAGLVAWYSVIHLPPSRRPSTFAAFARALRPGGVALLAFQVGDEKRHITHGYGHDVSVDAWRLEPEIIGEELRDARLEPLSLTTREPVDAETARQAFLLARRA